MLQDKFQLFINGKFVDGDMKMDVINPSTGNPATTECPRASEAQLDQAVAAAKAAFPKWRARPLADRKASLFAMGEALEGRAEELAKVLTTEHGRPFADSMQMVMGAAGFFKYFSSLDIPVEQIQDPDRDVEVYREPLGVCALIVPWNFPLMLIMFKLPMALLCGNTVVLKPAPTTPLVALKLAEIIGEMLPAGVFNVIVDNNDLGSILTKHQDVRKISFTGSTAVGKKIMESAASSLKRLTLELGGNDASIVLDDVNLAQVAEPLFMSAFYNNGQICIAVKRLYVHESIYDDVVAALAAIASVIPVGDGFAEGTVLGPMQNKKQYDTVQDFIQSAKADGTVLQDGPTPEGDGYFIRPAIVRDVTNGTKIVDEEQFGPVLPVIKYSTIEEAIALANDSEYGLGASVWSGDIGRAKQVAAQIEAGTIWINKHGEPAPHIPFAASKMSGIGVELSAHAINEFTQMKVISA